MVINLPGGREAKDRCTIEAARDAQGRLVLRGDEEFCQLARALAEALGREVRIEQREGH